MKPITDRQRAILNYLADLDDDREAYRRYPATPAQIAGGIGITDRPRRTRGPWSGNQSIAQRVIGSLTGLSQRRFIAAGRRPDGYTGSAYWITSEGRKEIGR